MAAGLLSGIDCRAYLKGHAFAHAAFLGEVGTHHYILNIPTLEVSPRVNFGPFEGIWHPIQESYTPREPATELVIVHESGYFTAFHKKACQKWHVQCRTDKCGDNFLDIPLAEGHSAVCRCAHEWEPTEN